MGAVVAAIRFPRVEGRFTLGCATRCTVSNFNGPRGGWRAQGSWVPEEVLGTGAKSVARLRLSGSRPRFVE